MNIFTLAYWETAAAELTRLKKLILAALFCALIVVVGAVYIPVGQSLQIHFTFFIVALGAAIYGPIAAMSVAVVADTLNYFLFNSAFPYFPGYMLSEVLVALVFGLLLYRQTISVPRIFFAKLLMNFPINVGLGALWSQILYGKGYLYYFWQSLIKNILLLPLEVLVAAGLFAAILPAAVRLKLLPTQSRESLERLRLQHNVLPILSGTVAVLGGSLLIFVQYGGGHWAFFTAGGSLLLVAAGLYLWHKIKK